MSIAPDNKTPVGCFENVETKKTFEYGEASDSWAAKYNLKHEIYVADGVRFAKVLKTVAYVAVDEAEDGTPVIEKWVIKHYWTR